MELLDAFSLALRKIRRRRKEIELALSEGLKKNTTTLMLSDCQSSDAVSSLFHLCMDLQASDFLGNNLPDLDSLQARWYQTW